MGDLLDRMAELKVSGTTFRRTVLTERITTMNLLSFTKAVSVDPF